MTVDPVDDMMVASWLPQHDILKDIERLLSDKLDLAIRGFEDVVGGVHTGG
eukprot:NODE_28909_length_462_cov_3.202985.p3 GENE.NODE_28909_length_462_cov_3.202985~~NODE_28909_length_462_cov_3.202985.p3  ORF type:complete len:51 (-),score=22.68 NODE_28909_length_462_cov_3.202985:121-273(-)